MDMEGFQALVDEGRRLLESGNSESAHHRFANWVEHVAEWLNTTAPGSSLAADWGSLGYSRLILGDYEGDTPEGWVHFQQVVEARLSWLARLAQSATTPSSSPKGRGITPSKKVFVVHGHDEAAKESVARFLIRLGLEPVILHEQPDQGRTIIEKFIDYSDVSFAIVLLTPDDVGGPSAPGIGRLKARARQNVILELGFFLGRLDRPHVCSLYVGDLELPSDYEGVIYIPFDKDGAWQLRLAREMKAAGVPFDLNLVV